MLAVTSSKNPSNYGDLVAFTTGTVAVSDGGTLIATVTLNASGIATDSTRAYCWFMGSIIVTLLHRPHKKEFSHFSIRSGYFTRFQRIASVTRNNPATTTIAAHSEISGLSWYFDVIPRALTPSNIIQTRQNAFLGFGGEHFCAKMLCLKVSDHPVLSISPRLERAIIDPLP
jgi:hypothetical protein